MISGGTWPTVDQGKVYKIFSVLIQSYFVVFVFTISLKCIMLMKVLDTSARANVFTFILEYWLTLWKVGVLKKQPIMDMMREIAVLEKDLQRRNDPKLMEIYKKYSVYNFKIGLILPLTTGFCALCMSGVFIVQWDIFKGDKMFVIPQQLPYKDHFYDFYYWNQLFCGMLGAIYIVCVDALIVSLIIFTTLRMKLLGQNLQMLFRDKNMNQAENNKHLRMLIMEHQNIIDHVVELNDNFKLLFFVDFSIKSYQLCLAMFNLLEVAGVPLMWAIFNTSESFLLLLQSVVIYSQSNDIIVESQELATSIYMVNWSGQPVSITRSLAIMMIRAQRALKLESYGIVILSSDLLQKVVKAGYTYIVLSLQNKK
ncbi:unnamed protein product [Phyllotreta striolata]|uniref:Odorant receptor n=1 Tax=Phyllotreta striolata TaxID=444603 RepID=A0A9N9TSI5_PHYSR|nr:unnamed protein product [Phyllotreta striolata]